MHLKGKQKLLDMKKLMICLSVLLLNFSLQLYSQESFQVEIKGNGQPILVFPGFTCTPKVFGEIINTLSENYEVHAFTFAGFGGVSPIDFPWLPKIKEDIQNYVKTNDLQDAALLGHSMGGTLGLWLATDSNQFAQLIIIDALPAMGALMIPNYDSEAITYDTPYNQQILNMDSEDFEKMAGQMASKMTNNKEKQTQITRWMVESDRKTYVYGYTDLLKLDLRSELNKINIPVTIFAATQPYGKKAVASTYGKQYKNLKNHTLIFAEGAGHFVMYDKPQWLLEQIQKALNTNE